MDVKATLDALKREAKEAITAIEKMHELNDVKAKYLGKKGPFADIMKLMRDVPNDEKPLFGKTVNEAKQVILQWLDEARERLVQAQIQAQLDKETIDVTLPGKKFELGTTHLLTQMVEDVEDLLIGMGYQVMEGPEVEQEEYNFEKLNLPQDHPARDMQDSFYISDSTLLRTHTSPVQVRTMLQYGGTKPVKIICPGKVYRRDDDDATHSHQFMQIEGLVVDEHTSMADLKGTLLEIANTLFGEGRDIRLRPSYFPFTEPSVEVDVSCHNCNGKGCHICKGTGWIEILGAGMVHNNVLEASGYDSTKYRGFAFGIGVERLAMLKYGINDIRMFYTNDIRFNRQFKK
ncbi:phenylalanine--tRNA ligase subunit alpha [Candidatus Xianfuyuplasma coldseepsis]|uniref:Phenylalanine--tRNA ligase alpha subunit n=1 Tax=Candidatus Xianfuyuplasma coldseepsis TaxID=2782163 RepID=A0A7L7KT37_9MOLU|nr:phenylalanine--tRNA ligase subunit alpha [Xianfuyuplasma coldseepsis]QMS85559.1 phenylalanine--tRNA ligase subunit alpha [Xianfuyuplasma coldseepsis]